ncbi:hypothetical protein ACN27F_12890 [Solwaraspora sp. WMMB335]|uniref:hypothetical protein n=1 Tax=Solwaraspora sp. WMMB335 TaxID=3404118 RepID=UPI003B92720B
MSVLLTAARFLTDTVRRYADEPSVSPDGQEQVRSTSSISSESLLRASVNGMIAMPQAEQKWRDFCAVPDPSGTS